MKTTISLLLLISLALAGCTASVAATASPKAAMTNPNASANPGNTQYPTNAPQQNPSYSKIKGPPSVLLLQTPVLSNDEKEFISAAFHIALNYPSSWSVKEQAGGVTFQSPSGAVISLQTSTHSSQI